MGCEPVCSKKGSNKGVDFWIRLRIKVQRLFHVSRQPNVNRPEHLDIPHTHTKRAHVFISLFIISAFDTDIDTLHSYIYSPSSNLSTLPHTLNASQLDQNGFFFLFCLCWSFFRSTHLTAYLFCCCCFFCVFRHSYVLFFFVNVTGVCAFFFLNFISIYFSFVLYLWRCLFC